MVGVDAAWAFEVAQLPPGPVLAADSLQRTLLDKMLNPLSGCIYVLNRFISKD